MSGYFAPEAAWWRVLRESLPRPWVREAALTDLRWWQDQVLLGAERRIPSYYALAEHWGWGEKRARLLLQAEEEWSDPAKSERWRAHRGRIEGASRAHEGRIDGARDPLPVELEAIERAHRGRIEGASRAHRGRIEGDTRVRSTDTDTDTDTRQTVVGRAEEATQLALATALRPAKPPKPDRYDEVALYFGEIVHRALGRRVSKGQDRKSKLGQKLERAVAKDADLVLDAMRFVAEGNGPRAVFLREKYADGLTIATVLAHLDEYAELWRAEQHPDTRRTLQRGEYPTQQQEHVEMSEETRAFWAEFGPKEAAS